MSLYKEVEKIKFPDKNEKGGDYTRDRSLIEY